MKKRTLFTLYFSLIAAMLGLSIISPILPTIATDLKATGVWMGLIVSGFAISRAIIMPVMGKLSDKHGRKIGSSLFCMGNSISLLSTEADYMRGMLNVERP